MTHDFLFELLTEELPPKRLRQLITAFTQMVEQSLKEADLPYQTIQSFATPRRLAILITNLIDQQPKRFMQRKGPALQAAFNDSGQPTKACLGFAHSCGTTAEKLEQEGGRVIFKSVEEGKKTTTLLPEMVYHALTNLPISKSMRWGSKEIEFVRPIHNIIMLYGKQIIPTPLFGLTPNNKTEGHRFLCKKKLTIPSPIEYETLLRKEGFVLVDFEKRKKKIIDDMEALIDTLKTKKTRKTEEINILMKEKLIDEVTSIVEWPTPLLGSFPEHFLRLPKEVLILSIEHHQKCFALLDERNKLLPHFITVSNIKHSNKSKVIHGNERVVNARLSDAEFFYLTDLKQPLDNHVDSLKNVLFQKQLGSLFDKIERITQLSTWLAPQIHANSEQVKRAAYLSKSDLMTNMVGEFPELQGIMGYYYATSAKEPKEVAKALNEIYMPRHARDHLPKTTIGLTLALADRIDTLVGLFGINKIPTGEKDPFALRRAALGIIRILIEKKLDLDLLALLKKAKKTYSVSLPNKNIIQQVFDFIQERLKSYALDLGFSSTQFMAVSTRNISNPFDFYRRLQAVNAFSRLKEAGGLSIANKRVSNILSKQTECFDNKSITEKYLKETAEINLAKLIEEKTVRTKKLYQEKDYVHLLKDLASMRSTIDLFFDNVMVMTDDHYLQQNRLILLARLRDLFLQVADISLLA